MKGSEETEERSEKVKMGQIIKKGQGQSSWRLKWKTGKEGTTYT